MADESSTSSGSVSLETLLKKVEREARFTRSLVVICTAAMLGVSLVPVKIMSGDLPKLLISELLGQLEIVHDNWAILDKTFASRHSANAAAASNAARAAANTPEESKSESK